MSVSELSTGLMNHFPEIVAIVIVAGGWILARVARHAIVTGLPRINRVSARLNAQPGSMVTPAFVQMLQTLVFWGILLSSVIFGLMVLGSGELTIWLDGLLTFGVQLLVALGILALGHILGVLTRDLLRGLPATHDIGSLPRLAYVVIMAIAAVTALRQLGLALTFFTQILLVLITVLLAGLALAFALGSRTLVANLAAQGELQRYKPGDRIIIDGIEGTVLEIHRTGVVLSTEQGRASIPASKFAEMTVTMNRPGIEIDE